MASELSIWPNGINRCVLSQASTTGADAVDAEPWPTPADKDDTTKDIVDKQEAAQRLIEALNQVVRGETESVEAHQLLNDQEHYALFGGDDRTVYSDTNNNNSNDKKKKKKTPGLFYADRHVAKMMQIVNDPDCRTKKLDATSDDFMVSQAVEILTKCSFVHIQNAIPRTVLEPYKLQVTSYLKGLQSGRIGSEGTTTFGEPYFIHETSPHRYDLLFPDNLLNEDIMAPPLLLKILQDSQVIGYVSLLVCLFVSFVGFLRVCVSHPQTAYPN